MAKKTKPELKLQNDTYWLEMGIDLVNRRIMLDEEVADFSTGMCQRALDVMIEADDTKPIYVIINSLGGDCYSGLALYDAIERIKDTPVITVGTGAIMSMGLIIFLASDYRVATPRSTFMAHSVSSGIWGKLREMEIDIKETKRLNDQLINILAEKTKHSLKWWKKEIQHEDQYYDVKKAKKLGIVTHDYPIEDEE